MSYVSDRIFSFILQLFPKGRAYYVPLPTVDEDVYVDETGAAYVDESGDVYVDSSDTQEGGIFARFLRSFAGDGDNITGTLERVYYDADRVLYSILPDNEFFTDGTVDPRDNDCDTAERHWGMVRYGVTSPSTPTRAERMAAILTRMRYPGTAAPRQAASYLQSQLQSSGFNVFVYENLDNLSPEEVLGIPVGNAIHGDFDHGQLNHGGGLASSGVTVIANSIDEAVDALFIVPPGNYHGIYYFAGATIDTFANVPAVRKTEFRQTLLRLKCANLAGYLFVNYV